MALELGLEHDPLLLDRAAFGATVAAALGVPAAAVVKLAVRPLPAPVRGHFNRTAAVSFEVQLPTLPPGFADTAAFASFAEAVLSAPEFAAALRAALGYAVAVLRATTQVHIPPPRRTAQSEAQAQTLLPCA